MLIDSLSDQLSIFFLVFLVLFWGLHDHDSIYFSKGKTKTIFVMYIYAFANKCFSPCELFLFSLETT